MATDTAATSARHNTSQQIGYLRRDFTFADDGSTLTMGILPAGAIVLRGGVVVSTAFNAGSTNVLDIGTSADPDGFATDLALGTVGVIVADEMATTNDAGPYAADTTIVCVVDLTGTAATTGVGSVWVEFIEDNDR
jgi:hypothetical protein